MTSPVVLITGALTESVAPTAVAFAKSMARALSSPAAGTRKAKHSKRNFAASATEAFFIKADVRHDDEVRDLVDQTVARFAASTRPSHTAGTEGKPGPVDEQTAESYAATFDTNVLGTLLSMKHELRAMLPQGKLQHRSTYPRLTGTKVEAGASVYVGSKHAVEGMTKAAALEAASSRVRVNAVAPGPIETGMLDRFTGTAERKAALVKTVPLGRVGDPGPTSRVRPSFSLRKRQHSSQDRLLLSTGPNCQLKAIPVHVSPTGIAQGSRRLRAAPRSTRNE